MSSFNQLLSSFSADPNIKGRQFEHFAKWYFENDPVWTTTVSNVWLWKDYPSNWGGDLGIDLVCRLKNGEDWAVQAKCYNEAYPIKKEDIDSFLSESSRSAIHGRVLIAITDYIGNNATNVINGQDKPVVRVLLQDLRSSAVVYPEHIDQLRAHVPRDPNIPRPHQRDAIDAVTKRFKTEDRGQLIMACGTGKTMSALWIKEALEAKNTLVLLPSLFLLSQTLREWTANRSDEYEALCVCSDDTVSHDDDTPVSEVPFPVTTDVSEIRQFLSRPGSKVVFSSYQSSPKLAEAQAQEDIPEFDLVIADEAHKCAGQVSSDFGTVLDQAKVRAAKRLFMTATPRTFSAHVSRRASDRGVDVMSMDDEAVFGGVFHRLTFGQAIASDLLSDYQVVIVGVDDPTIREFIADRELLQTDSGIDDDAETLASKIGLLKAIKDYDLRRMISFHSYVKGAQKFSETLPKVVEWLPEEQRPTGNLRADYVSGKMPTGDRVKTLNRLRTLESGERRLVSNARCLSEGIDVPTLDGVVFIDSKKSKVDIVQAVGRAIRKTDDKTHGTIVLPVFIGDWQDANAELSESRFSVIWDCLNALRAHDEVLAEEMDKLRTELGRRGNFNGFSPKIVFDLPKKISSAFASAFKVRLLETTTVSWMFSFGLLEAYKDRERDCLVSQGYKTESGYKLGNWCSAQRQGHRDGSLSADRIARLENIGFEWDAFSAAWTEGYGHLKAYREREHDCLVSQGHKTESGYKLGNWCSTQRQGYRDGSLSADRIRALEELGFDWDPVGRIWTEGYEHLRAYKERNGDCKILKTHKTASGHALGKWCQTQRSHYSNGSLSADRIRALEALGFDWDPRERAWTEAYDHLKAYKEREHDCLVSRGYKTESGYKLGSWCSDQRKRYNDESLSADRIRKLEVLGFEWDPHTAAWTEGYGHLKAYKEREHDCLVSGRYNTESGYKLGYWVAGQRRSYNDGSLSADRIRALEELGFDWDPIDRIWTEGYEHLRAYKEREGDCSVPRRYKAEAGFALGDWCGTQRKKRKAGKLSTDRILKLAALGFDWGAKPSH